ncbi:MAG: hypothetical protein IT161_12905 [Bryobacterales bacterium]|nr:hypothetical protein [Bryobacterales bacterium]
MNISVRTRDIVLSDELEKQIERSIAFAVDRHSSRVTQVSVYLADLNGPRGGVDKLCQITAELKGSIPVLILERGDDLVATVSRAAKRLGYRIGRRVQRVRTVSARGPRTPRIPVETWPAIKKSA